MDERWSFVGTKANRHWVCIAMAAIARQIVAFHVTDRSRQNAEALWEKIPIVYQEQARCFMDQEEVSTGVIPTAQHRSISKLAHQTDHVERFICTFRQRVSRLVRSTLVFSKEVENHLGAIHFFIYYYNLIRAALFVSHLIVLVVVTAPRALGMERDARPVRPHYQGAHVTAPCAHASP